MSSRVVRLFISSTFRDFVEERELLTRSVIPELQRRARDRYIALISVDLRWGITEEESQSGATIPICLREIDRARPYFIGLLGERYGWTPPADHFPPELLASRPWLEEYAGSASVTELEILHGAISCLAGTTQALFYLRDPRWSEGRGPHFASEGPQEQERLASLKEQIRASGLAVVEYESPEHMASLITEDLWRLIDAEYPADAVPDELARERLAHDACAARRRDSATTDDRLLADLESACEGSSAVGDAPIEGRIVLVRGREGSGKSTLLSRVPLARLKHRPHDEVFEHYAGATRESTGAANALRRLAHFCAGENVADVEYKELAKAVPLWLGTLAARMEQNGTDALILLDGIDQLDGPEHVPWLPSFIPPRIVILASVGDTFAAEVLAGRAQATIVIDDRGAMERADVLRALLARQSKRLDDHQLVRIAAHPQAGTPAFLAAVVHDLCVSATHETLDDRIGQLLQCDGVDDVLEQSLAAAEQTAGMGPVRLAAIALATSRDGLAVEELLDRCSLTPLSWARVEAALGPLVAQAADMTVIASDHARRAIRDRYTLRDELLRETHASTAQWWLNRGTTSRTAFELPFQLAEANLLDELRSLLCEQVWIECLLVHRSEEEILGLWRTACNGKLLDVAAEYQAVVAGWDASAIPAHGEFLMRLGGFISYAGGPGTLAASLLERAVAATRLSSSPEQDLAIRLNNLGHEQLLIGHTDEAIRSFGEALDIRGRCLPEGHPHTLGTIDNLGQAHHAAGRRDDALRYMRAALKLRLRHLGEHDPDTSTSRNNLAMMLLDGGGDAGDLPEAGRLLEEAYASSVHSLGPRHPDTGISGGNLGLFHARHGDESRARILMESALAIHLNKFGKEHEYVAVGRARLADLELGRGLRAREAGRLDEARDILAAELDLRSVHYGEGSLPWAAVASALAETLARDGDIAAAHSLFRQVLEVRSRELGPEHRLTRLVVERLEGIGGRV